MSKQICMFYGPKTDFIRVMCGSHDRKKLMAMGWKDHPDHLEDEVAEVVEVKPEPVVEIAKDAMSDIELTNAVIDADSKDAVENLIKIHRAIDIDKRGKLETVKEKALAVINGNGS